MAGILFFSPKAPPQAAGALRVYSLRIYAAVFQSSRGFCHRGRTRGLKERGLNGCGQPAPAGARSKGRRDPGTGTTGKGSRRAREAAAEPKNRGAERRSEGGTTKRATRARRSQEKHSHRTALGGAPRAESQTGNNRDIWLTTCEGKDASAAGGCTSQQTRGGIANTEHRQTRSGCLAKSGLHNKPICSTGTANAKGEATSQGGGNNPGDKGSKGSGQRAGPTKND